MPTGVLMPVDKYVYPGLDGHYPGIGQTWSCTRESNSFFNRSVVILAPLISGLELNKGFNHGQRCGVGGRIRPPALPKTLTTSGTV